MHLEDNLATTMKWGRQHIDMIRRQHLWNKCKMGIAIKFLNFRRVNCKEAEAQVKGP